MTYEIILLASGYALRDKATGQIDFSHFPTRKMLREWWNIHWGWRLDYRIEW